MKVRTRIPAATAAAREGLDLTLLRTDGADGTRLRLRAGAGEATVLLGPMERHFLVSWGKLTVEPGDRAPARAFVAEVAAWLGLAMGEVPLELPETPVEPLDGGWARLGRGRDPSGTEWDTLKLSFAMQGRVAEVFLRIAGDGRSAQLIEKESYKRTTLVEILERSLCPGPPRPVHPAEESPPPISADGLTLSVHGAFELRVPEGWGATQRGGSYRLTDPDDEMAIDVLYEHLPALPPGAPDVAERLRAVMASSDRIESPTPIETSTRDGIAFAWSEHRFESHDAGRKDAQLRPGRARLLIAANDWIQAILVGSWWEDNRDAGERAWSTVVDSLLLSGRLPTEPRRGPEA